MSNAATSTKSAAAAGTQSVLTVAVVKSARSMRQSLRDALHLGEVVSEATASGAKLLEVFERVVIPELTAAEAKLVLGRTGKLTAKGRNTWKVRLSQAQGMYTELVVPLVEGGMTTAKAVTQVASEYGSRNAAAKAVVAIRKGGAPTEQGVNDDNASTPTELPAAKVEPAAKPKRDEAKPEPAGDPESGSISDAANRKAKILVDRSTFNKLNALRSGDSWDEFLTRLADLGRSSGKQPKADTVSKRNTSTAA